MRVLVEREMLREMEMKDSKLLLFLFLFLFIVNDVI